MERLADIIYSISSDAILTSASETAHEYTATYKSESFDAEFHKLSNALGRINLRDSFTLVFAAATSETAFSLSSRDPTSVEAFFQQLKNWHDAFGKISGSLKLRIGKVPQRKIISIYSLPLFTEYMCHGNPTEVLGKISHLASLAYYLECDELTEITQSTLFCIGPRVAAESFPRNPESAQKSKYIELRSKACAVYSSGSHNFIPSDFVFDKDILGSRLAELFTRISLLYCLISIADTTRIDQNGEISFTVKGYTTEKLSITSLSDIDTSAIQQYHAVYYWAYTDGNIIDKLGICRNLLTIHAKDGGILKLKDGWLESTASNHAIYLKENLKQYVDLKNKLSDQIQKGSEKASDIAKNITAYLRTSIFSLTSFLLSAFVVRTLAKPTATEPAIITSSVYWLFLLIVGISILILIYALVETNAEKIRYIKSYKAFKARYTDLLSKQDINFIFNNDKDFARDIRYIRDTRKKSVVLWVCVLMIMTTVVTIMKVKGL